ncbi:uncharacterized protein N7482_002026 [Penicillium canariense]|uniref:Uncharacterized protein n=1 Tax=Penicillium canariense TaxID=189055 RepID=A0A9W9LUG0_9EURO|nr:uncharacterized protein N7482_002026 [Penicillium canariense]KAJ5176149.1 hypothetical protein N7482_002026 [Penicillium canariense]
MPGDRAPSPLDKSRVSLLFVVLTQLDDVQQAKLVQHYKQTVPDSANVAIHTWTPSKILLQSIARQGPHRDSAANLYALGILAYRSRWSSFIVVDDLTKRQVTGQHRVAESEDISVVLMSVQGSPNDAHTNHQVMVKARRTSKNDQGVNILDVLSADIDLPTETGVGGDECPTKEYFETGKMLYDPDTRLFTATAASSLGAERITAALSATHLPTELVHAVLSYVNADNSKTGIRNGERAKPPLWTSIQDDAHILIFLLFPTTAEELRNAQVTIQNAAKRYLPQAKNKVPKKIVELIPQDRHHIASRHDLVQFMKEYERPMADGRSNRAPLNFLLNPITGADVASAEFGTAHRAYDSRVVVTQVPLKNILDNRWFSKWQRDWWRTASVRFPTEAIYPPNEPFYPNPVPWRPVGTKEGTDESEEVEYLAVFYITNKLTEEQDEAVRARLATKNDIDQQFGYIKKCCYVPWEGEEDGTDEDIWSIVWQVWEDGGDQVFFCIDQLSGEDQSVLCVECDRFSYRQLPENAKHLTGVCDPNLRGFRCTRVPAEDAQIDKVNLDIANMGMEDFGPVHKFRRPGWPARGIIPDETDDEEEAEEEE